jgi:hypothetical protein
VSDLIKEVTNMMGTMQIATTPYSHEENSLVERSHGETLRHLRAVVFERLTNTKWRRYLPLVQRIINAQVLSAIGCTPTEMLFGKSIDTNRGIYLEFTTAEQKSMPCGAYVQDLVRMQGLIIKTAQRLLKEHEVEHTSGPNRVTEFATHSYVLLKYPEGPNRSSKPPTKLHTNQRGPFKVLRHDATDYWLLDIVTNKPKKRPVHVSRLAAFNYDPAKTSPLDVARRDIDEFIVEEVVNHRHTEPEERKLKGRLEFRVKWLGHGADEDSWEPFNNMKEVKAMHRYLHRVGLDREIPARFRRADYDADSDGEVEDDF